MEVTRSNSYNATPPNPWDIFPIGKLTVTVMKARGIKGDESHGFGKADPYVIITLGGRDHGRQTSTPVDKDAGSEPVWNHHAVFPVRSQSEEFDHLNIVIYNENHWPRTDHIIGALSMRGMCRMLRDNCYAVEARWFPLYYNGNPRGQICLSFIFTPMSAEKLLQEADIFDGDDKKRHRNKRDVDDNHSPLIDWNSVSSVLVTVGIGVVQGITILVP